MRHSIISAAFVWVAGLGVLASCEDEPNSTATQETVDETLTLESDDTGALLACEGEVCQRVANPEGCAQLEVTIDTASGSSCARCLDIDGSVLSERCDGTLVSCTLVTAPEPDCVVCAHASGNVLFSSCVADFPLECVAFAEAVDPVA
ncbi:MAG: hypothetical protein AAFY60_05695, partial [Myxococcota bacterium]